MSLARALVKNAKIIILDEATGEFSECLYVYNMVDAHNYTHLF